MGIQQRYDDHSLHVNRRFALESVERMQGGARILDFGCGDAAGIDWGRRHGIHVVGADIRPTVEDPWLHPCTPVSLPFGDASFDAVVSNMVFEHVMYPREALAELHRVLKPEGIMIHLWPSSEAVFEGHCRLFFAQNLRSEAYLRACYRLGLGVRGKNRKTPQAYAEKWLRYMEEECNYLPHSNWVRLFVEAGFSFEHIEHEYLRYRLGRSLPYADRILRRLTTMVVLSTKSETNKTKV